MTSALNANAPSQESLATSDSLDVNRVFPTTLEQELRLVLHEVQQARPAPTHFQRLVIGLRIRGRIEKRHVSKALNELIRRHPTLRIQFRRVSDCSEEERREVLSRALRTGVVKGGLYSQVVVEAEPVPLRMLELPTDSAAMEEELQRVIHDELTRPVNGLAPPHLHAILAVVGEADFVLTLFVNHLVADGRSMYVLRKDFRQALALTIEGRAFPEHSGDWGFLVHAETQRRGVLEGTFSDSLAFWRDEWARFGQERIAPEHFPFVSSSTKAEATASFAAATIVLDGASAHRIRTSAKKCRVTQHTYFLALFGLALRNVTGQSKIAVWTHLLNRSKAAFMDSVGWFAQTHLVGFLIEGPETLQELLWAVHSKVRTCSKHEHLPLIHLWGSLGCYPRFQDARVLLDFAPYTPLPFDIGGQNLVEDLFAPDQGAPRLASLGLYIRDLGDSISVQVKYADSLYAKSDVEQFLEDFAVLTERASDNVQANVADYLTSARPTPRARIVSEAMAEFIVDMTRIGEFPVRSKEQSTQ